jgi:hypothetical protein
VALDKNIKNVVIHMIIIGEMDKTKFEICNCQCHKFSMKHCAPCCYPCPHCHQNIIPNMFDTHTVRCKENSKNIFIQRYCHISKISIDTFNEALIALECNCKEQGCSGWAVVSNDELSIKTHKELYGTPD